MTRIATSLILAGALLWSACSSKKSGSDEPRAPQAAQPAQAGETDQPSPEATMSDSQSALDRINELLKKHPATEQMCGEKQSALSLDGGQLVLESSWSKCPGGDRSTAPAAELDVEAIETELVPEYGQARIYIPCRGGKACSPRFTRDENEAEWRQLRDESTFTVDCAPDAGVMQELAAELRGLLQSLGK